MMYKKTNFAAAFVTPVVEHWLVRYGHIVIYAGKQHRQIYITETKMSYLTAYLKNRIYLTLDRPR